MSSVGDHRADSQFLLDCTATAEQVRAANDERAQFIDADGQSLWGRCSWCSRRVDNHDDSHRVTSIVRGGKGVECVDRGDITFDKAQPLGRAS